MDKISPKEEIDHFKQQIDIMSYLKDVGYSIDKERDTPRYRAFSHEASGDKVFIPINSKYPNPNFYVNQYDTKDRGTILDFVMTRQQKDMDGARETLRAYLGTGDLAKVATKTQTQQQETENDDMLKRRRQLFIVQRITEGETGVNEPYLQKRLLVHDTRHHVAFQDVVKLNEAPDARFVAFPLKNEIGEVAGVAMKSATKERFLGNREGAWVSSPTRPDQPVDKAIITEDPVDAMSYHQLRGSRTPENLVYISPAGNPSAKQLEVIKGHIAILEPKAIVLANDNDGPGKKYDQKYQASLKETGIPIQVDKPTFKDWNADLSAEQVYRSRLLDRSNPHPEQVANPEKVKVPDTVERMVQDRTTKNYPSFAGDPSLGNYYLERPIDGKKVEFNLSEVAYINNDRKLGELLGIDVDQGYLVNHYEKSKTLSVSVQQESKRIALETSPATREAQVKNTTDKIIEGKAALQSANQYVSSLSTEVNQKSPGNTPEGTDQPGTSTSLQDKYTQRIENLQKEMRKQPGSDRVVRQLDYYQRYPHLQGSEIENYVTAEETVQANQRGKSMTLGKQQERGL